MNEQSKPKRRAWLHAAVLGALVLTAVSASAMSSTDQVAWRDKPVLAQADWPEGVLDLVNDPFRTEGWKPWFSEWPNDVNYYVFQVEGTNDVNRLITKLAAIKSAKACILLSPEKEPRMLAFTTVLDEGNGAAAVFSLGSQKRIDEWYEHLQEGEPGVRVFGVHRFQDPPKAQPPTLTLYVGNEAIDLRSLKIPPSVKVAAFVSRAARAKGGTLVQAIDDFVARRQVNPAEPTQAQPAPLPTTNPPGAKPDGDPSGGQHSLARSRAAAIPGSDNEHIAWVEGCLRDFASIKPGMTRQEVESKFNLDGGLQGTSPVRFCHPSCPYFKVDVQFEFKRDPADQGRAITAKDDKVIRVSKPYLEAPYMD